MHFGLELLHRARRLHMIGRTPRTGHVNLWNFSPGLTAAPLSPFASARADPVGLLPTASQASSRAAAEREPRLQQISRLPQRCNTGQVENCLPATQRLACMQTTLGKSFPGVAEHSLPPRVAQYQMKTGERLSVPAGVPVPTQCAHQADQTRSSCDSAPPATAPCSSVRRMHMHEQHR